MTMTEVSFKSKGGGGGAATGAAPSTTSSNSRNKSTTTRYSFSFRNGGSTFQLFLGFVGGFIVAFHIRTVPYRQGVPTSVTAKAKDEAMLKGRSTSLDLNNHEGQNLEQHQYQRSFLLDLDDKNKTGDSYSSTSSSSHHSQETTTTTTTAAAAARNEPFSIRDQDKAVFIHIGKSGGSSARCMLHPSLGEGTCRDGKFLRSLNPDNEFTAIHNRTVGVCHQLVCETREPWRVDNPNAPVSEWPVVNNFPIIILSVRDPLDRILSWFLYGRKVFQNKAFGLGRGDTDLMPDGRSRVGMQIFRCYPEFADVARAVQAWTDNKKTNYTDYGRVANRRTNYTEATCQDFARKCIDGSMYCSSDHNWQNYGYYLRSIIDPDRRKRRGENPGSSLSSSSSLSSPTAPPIVYVARNEYKWEDFYTINLLLGGTATSFHPSVVQLTAARKSSESADSRKIPDETRQALCRLLCDEIHIYEATLYVARNLHDAQVRQSVQEMRESCLVSTEDEMTRLCGVNPYIEPNLAAIINQQDKEKMQLAPAPKSEENVDQVQVSHHEHPPVPSPPRNPKNRVVPDFVIGGTPKGGTSSLFQWLLAHPNLVPPSKKEINYFDRNHDKGVEWYRSHWPKDHDLDPSSSKLTFEATPNYIYSLEAPQRAYEHSPHLKMIFLLRDPVDRALSDWKMWIRQGLTKRPFAAMINDCVNIIRGNTNNTNQALKNGQVYEQQLSESCHSDTNPVDGANGGSNLCQCRENIVAKGLYGEQIQRWTKVFPREQVLILRAKTMYEEPLKTLRLIEDFLAIPHFEYSDLKAVNTADKPINAKVAENDQTAVNAETRKILERLFAESPQVSYDN